MIHIVLIVVHATAAVASFGLGTALLVRPPRAPRSARLALYAIAIVVAVAALVTVVVVDWGGLGVIKRVAFGGLSVLGVVLLVRSALALRLDRVRGPGWAARFLGHIGFVLISLFDGFCIVTAIDLHLPVWAIIAAAVLGVAAGVVATKAATRRVARTTDALAGGAA